MKLQSKSRKSVVLVTPGIVVLALLLIGPREPGSSLRSREAVFASDLRTIRNAIDDYTLDKRERPHSLQDLVDAGYLRAIPVDPITHKADWLLDFEVPVLGDPVLAPELRVGGLVDLHSNSRRTSHYGSKYSEW